MPLAILRSDIPLGRDQIKCSKKRGLLSKRCHAAIYQVQNAASQEQWLNVALPIERTSPVVPLLLEVFGWN